MRLDFPLVEYHDEIRLDQSGRKNHIGSRVGYLLRVCGDSVIIQPIGPIGAVPEKITQKIEDVQLVDRQGKMIAASIYDISLPVDAGEIEVKLERERIKNMVEKKSKSAQKAPASVKYLLLTDKAPETKDLKEGSHAYAVIAGLRKLSTAGVQGKATRERLMECIKSNKLLNTDMDPAKAISWMTGQLKGKGIIKEVKEAVA